MTEAERAPTHREGAVAALERVLAIVSLRGRSRAAVEVQLEHWRAGILHVIDHRAVVDEERLQEAQRDGWPD